MQNTKNILEVALHYQSLGLSVIPIQPRNKAPIPVGWERYSTMRSTKEEIEQWWGKTPDANIGIALGPANSEDGRYLFVVDQDVLKDENKVPILNEDGSFKQKGDIRGCPATLSQTTGSGGKQFFYWAPKGYIVGNPKPRPLIDVKGFRGQVLVPPSIHPNGKGYSWDMGDFSRDSIAEFPQDALDALLGEQTKGHLRVASVLGGLPIGEGLRHMGIAQVAGFYLSKARTPEEIEMARTAIYAWDREKNKSPEPWEERKREIDNTFEGILKLETAKPVRAVSNWTPSVPLQTSKPIFACFADIRTESIHWLWPERIALGKPTLIVGDPNIGKSLFTATIAATVSKGGLWPVDNTSSPIGDVIMLSAEDDAADTIKPRLEAAGADSRRIHVLQAIRYVNLDGTATQRMFSLKHDLSALEEMLSSLPECKLIIIDPISAYLDETDSHRNAAIRGLLAPLAVLATKRKVAIIAIDHLNKNSRESNMLYRPGGSLAFVAVARAAYLMTKDKENPNRRLFMPLKNNIAKENTGLAYTVVSTENNIPVIVWEPEPVKDTAEEMLAFSQSLEQRTGTDEAVDFLLDKLVDGPIKADDAIEEAKTIGISSKSLRNARGILRIKPRKSSSFKDSYWIWSLPEDALKTEDTDHKKDGALNKARHLGNTPKSRLDEFVDNLELDRDKDGIEIPLTLKDKDAVDKISPTLPEPPPVQEDLPF